MRAWRKVLALAVAAAMLTVPALAAEAEAEAESAKEEVVYINLSADGTVKTVDVVNIFELDEAGTIEDRGAYSAVRNMTTEDELTLEGDTVTAEAGPGRLCYEGRLEGAESPWNVSVTYTLDGEEVSAEALAGASGLMELHLTVEKNPACAGSYFDDMALQAVVTLDMDRCRSIQAPGATVANVGGDKQLTYTILPGQGADVTISAQVTDFEMEGIALNGLALSLQLDSGSLTEALSALPEAIADLDDGAAALAEGAAALAEGAGTLDQGAETVGTGAADLSAGAETLDGGAQTLSGATGQFAGGLATLTGQSEALVSGSAAVKEGLSQLQQSMAAGMVTPEQTAALQEASSALGQALEQLSAGVTALSQSVAAVPTDQLGSLQQQNTAAIEQLNMLAQYMDGDTAAAILGAAGLLQTNNDALSQIDGALGGLDALATAVADLQAGFEAFSGQLMALLDGLGSLPENMAALQGAVDALVAGYDTVDAGIGAYTAGAAALEESFAAIDTGAADLAAGSAGLVTGAAALGTGASDLADGIADVSDGAADLDEGASALAEGTAALREQTDGLADKIDEALQGLAGSGEKPMSFASAENGTVDLVQFVLRTPAIEKPAPAQPEATPAPEASFWTRLTDLF